MCSGLDAGMAQRHLMRTQRAFDLLAVHDFRTGPALGRLQDNHRPLGPAVVSVAARIVLDRADLVDDSFQCCRHCLMHRGWVIAFHEVRLYSRSP